MKEDTAPQKGESPAIPELIEIDTSTISSTTLARLIEEVRNDELPEMHAYNRTHHRHNRGH